MVFFTLKTSYSLSKVCESRPLKPLIRVGARATYFVTVLRLDDRVMESMSTLFTSATDVSDAFQLPSSGRL